MSHFANHGCNVRLCVRTWCLFSTRWQIWQVADEWNDGTWYIWVCGHFSQAPEILPFEIFHLKTITILIQDNTSGFTLCLSMIQIPITIPLHMLHLNMTNFLVDYTVLCSSHPLELSGEGGTVRLGWEERSLWDAGGESAAIQRGMHRHAVTGHAPCVHRPN